MTDQPIALITGGAQGIGYACAEAIAENGARIILVDINAHGVKTAAEKLGGGTVALACDMGDAAQVTATFDKIEADFGASDKASYITGETIYVDGGRPGLNYTC